MKDAFAYILLSFLEGFSFFFLAFGLFRIDMRDYLKEIILAIVLISIGTFYVSEVNMISNFIPIINIMLIMLFMVILFKVPLRYSIIVVLMSYPLCMGLQWVILKIAALNGLPMQEIKDSDNLRRTFQLISSTAIVTISYILRRFNLWFTFVPYEPNGDYKVSVRNILIVAASILILIIFGYSLNFSYTIVGIMIWAITFLGLFFVALKKEHDND